MAIYLFINIPTQVVGFIIGYKAGPMIYITADELISHSSGGTNHQTIFSLIIGIIFVILLGII